MANEWGTNTCVPPPSTHWLVALLVATLNFSSAGATAKEADESTATVEPDRDAWRLFIRVNTRADGENATFETWASNFDTFIEKPKFPEGATQLKLKRPALVTFKQAPAISGNINPSEEIRRNRPAFDFIINNNLHKVSGLQAVFKSGSVLSFPQDSIEVKANWIPVASVPSWTNKKVSIEDAAKIFHVNTAVNGAKYALVSMHIISKSLPNWTWATFEHWTNRARCDVLGCRDFFGAAVEIVGPNKQGSMGYPTCVKSAKLVDLLDGADLDPAFRQYCLKGTQIDFTDNTGLATRLGNSVTEQGFLRQSSCMTCHARAAWNRDGVRTSTSGFDSNLHAHVGPPQPSWYWTFKGQPPVAQGASGLNRIATSADFVWSIPNCAFDDSTTPPKTSRCLEK